MSISKTYPQQPTILVVDDTPIHLHLLTSMLAEELYNVIAAPDGLQALAFAFEDPPDLILLDILMPQIDGYQICKKLKSNERTCDIPIIFISSINGVLDKVKAFSLGAVDYITKPFEKAEVLSRTKTHLAFRNMQKELQAKNKQLEQENAQRKRAELALSQTNEQLEQLIAKRTSDLIKSNVSLTHEIAQHKRTAQELEKHRHHLEELVEVRTAELKRVNQQLQQDIAARKQVEEALRQSKEVAESANRAKSIFLANMSHELRTPLNGILGYAQILQRDTALTENQRDGVAVIRQSGEHLLTLLNDILDLSKIEAGRLELEPVVFHLEKFLQSIVNIFAMRTKQKGVKFHYIISNELPVAVKGDEIRLRQVLINLLGNAVKFTDTGTVTFQVSPVNCKQSATNKIRFAIKDTGIGIPQEALQKIFEPFQQVGKYARTKQGTGLGLAISKKLVAIMGGDLGVESTHEQGSEFWIEINLPPAHSWIDITKVSGQSIIGYNGTRQKVLVVDDIPDNRDILINMLRPLGFNVLEADNGQDAVKMAATLNPDLVLMDLIMSGEDGFSTTQQIRQLLPSLDVVIIAVSASAFGEDEQRSIDIGCDDFISKPVKFNELFEKLQHHLNLEWIYKNKQHQEMLWEQRPPPDVEGLVLPPAEKLAALLKLAQIGDISGIQAQLKLLEASESLYQPFVFKIRQLARKFQIDKIREWLEFYQATVTDS